MIDTDRLSKIGPCKTYKAKQHVPFRKGSDPSEREIYLLLSGGIDVFTAESGGKSPAFSVRPGEPFGGYEFFYGSVGRVFVASVDSVVFVLTLESLPIVSRDEPELTFELLKAAYAQTEGAPAQQYLPPKQTESVTRETGATTATVTQPEPEPPAIVVEAIELEENEIFPAGHKSYPGITKPEFAKLLIKKQLVCPYCKKNFSGYKVFRSKLYQSEPMRYDLRQFYRDFQTEWYDVITCPHCYFSMYHTLFTDQKPLLKQKIADKLMEVKSSIVLDFDAERDIDFVFTSHYIALVCAPGYLSNGRQLRAKLWGNLSWLYEDIGDREMEIYAANCAAAAYENVFSETRLTPVQEQITCMSIAGMLYRAGNMKNVKKFLFTAKTIKFGDRTYSVMADNLMETLREQDAEQTGEPE